MDKHKTTEPGQDATPAAPNPAVPAPLAKPAAPAAAARADEIGGPKGLEPTRYGDWERKGICVDF
ncbi:MAG: DUF1674 domain-containing protein [Alphaproteobacteria bacterium]|nr:DUF1674 domain-containing protein [Alphaproteobacteria bacterium]